jgi:hypothetical protein
MHIDELVVGLTKILDLTSNELIEYFNCISKSLEICDYDGNFSFYLKNEKIYYEYRSIDKQIRKIKSEIEQNKISLKLNDLYKQQREFTPSYIMPYLTFADIYKKWSKFPNLCNDNDVTEYKFASLIDNDNIYNKILKNLDKINESHYIADILFTHRDRFRSIESYAEKKFKLIPYLSKYTNKYINSYYTSYLLSNSKESYKFIVKMIECDVFVVNDNLINRMISCGDINTLKLVYDKTNFEIKPIYIEYAIVYGTIEVLQFLKRGNEVDPFMLEHIKDINYVVDIFDNYAYKCSEYRIHPIERNHIKCFNEFDKQFEKKHLYEWFKKRACVYKNNNYNICVDALLNYLNIDLNNKENIKELVDLVGKNTTCKIINKYCTNVVDLIL